MDFTSHAKTRSRQRGFNPLLVEIIASCGRQVKGRNGAIKIVFGKKESRDLVREVKGIIQLVDKVNLATLVIKDGRVITLYKHR